MESVRSFVKANSRNLPEVNMLMILEYVQSSNKLSINEIKEVKRLAASEENYIIDVIGFVKLKKDESKCIVKAKVLPVEDVAKKYYTVHVNVQENTITDGTCDCRPELAGGCKHTLLFLCWLEIKSLIPERAPVQSFWHKPLLGTPPLLIKDLFRSSPRMSMERGPRNPAVLESFVRECRKRNISNSLITMYNSSS